MAFWACHLKRHHTVEALADDLSQHVSPQGRLLVLDRCLRCFTASVSYCVWSYCNTRVLCVLHHRWHNIDQAVSLRWNKQDPKISSPKSQKYSLVKAWSFDRVAVPSQLPPDAQSSPATDSGSGSKSCAPASAQHPDKIFDQYINDIISAISKTLVWLQQAVTAVIKHIKHASSKVLQRVVWFWAGAGDPGKVPVYDEDKFTSINTDAYLLKAVSEKPGEMCAWAVAVGELCCFVYHGRRCESLVTWHHFAVGMMTFMMTVCSYPSVSNKGCHLVGLTGYTSC